MVELIIIVFNINLSSIYVHRHSSTNHLHWLARKIRFIVYDIYVQYYENKTSLIVSAIIEALEEEDRIPVHRRFAVRTFGKKSANLTCLMKIQVLWAPYENILY